LSPAVAAFQHSGAFKKGALGDAPKDFLEPKCRLKKRLTGKFGYLILRKITTFVAIRCQILKLKCTKCNFGWGTAQGLAAGVYSAPPDPLLDLRGLT